MITPARILNKYRSAERYLELVRAQVRDTLLVFCEGHGFATVSRVKTLESVAEKVETGRYECWADIDDLVAFTVVAPTLADEPKVLEFLSIAFEPIKTKARGSSRKAPDVFRFDCTRFIGRLRVADQASRGPIHDILFEVQIRSAFEHAWSVTTHALAYKSADVSWSKLRMTAQLKAAVEQLDTLVLSFEDAAKYIDPSAWPEIKAKSDMRQFFGGLVTSGRIPVELTPKDWSRFVDNVYGLVTSRHDRIKTEEVSGIVQLAIESELVQLEAHGVPRSISLWQLTFASLVKAGSVGTPLRNHWPLVTPELETLYPRLREFGPRFDYT